MTQFLISAAQRAQLVGADMLTILPGTPLAEAWLDIARQTRTTVDSRGCAGDTTRVRIA